MVADSAKVLLAGSNQQRYRAFTLNTESKLYLPRPSSVPWIGATTRHDVFRKECSHDEPHHVKFITKNNKPYEFVWQTNAEQLKQAARWGIIRTHSITSKVIGTLGQYRIKAHERAAKGMVSNSQAVKLKLLDLYQDRFTALQQIESLVNKNNNPADFNKHFKQYILFLQKLEVNLDTYFADVMLCGLNTQMICQIKEDIGQDIKRAETYLKLLQKEETLRSYNRARGEKSVLEFVKQQMIHGLYELQGINQDISYSRERFFALTRGEMNDFIEDARKIIDDHQADTRNAVTEKHHGNFSANEEELLTYDFSQDQLSVAREKQILLAISFIEGWDKLENNKDNKPFVSNGPQKEDLDIYTATRWKTHRNLSAAFKSVGYYLANMFKGIFFPTHSWEEEPWSHKGFHLNAVKLQAHVKPIEPMWKKPVYFITQIFYALVDIFSGVRDFGIKLTVHLPADVVNDWASSQLTPSLDSVILGANNEICAIKQEEQDRLLQILQKSKNQLFANVAKPTSKLVDVEYELGAEEQNDILNVIVRGLNNFSAFFTHDIYAKDPVGGLIFSTTYLAGIGMIYLPTLSSSIFGSSVVNSFNNLSYAMASSPLGAAIAGGSTLAELSVIAWDGALHGSSGLGANMVYQFGEDPLTIGAYCAAAYGLGYLLANGISGYQIPWLSERLREDLGRDPSTGYPIIGAKFAIILYEILITHHKKHYDSPELKELSSHTENVLKIDPLAAQRFKYVLWLSTQAANLPKLEPRLQFALECQLDLLFTKEESASLKKLIYPEKHPSIAFQIVSIPLTYIPAIVRFIVSFLLSAAVWCNGNPYPLEPIKRSGSFLWDKIKRDFSRIIICAANTVYLGYTLVAATVKMFTYIGVMAVGRFAGLVNGTPGHDSHKWFASVHNLMRSIGEFFYPARMVKDVTVGHPTDTLFKVETSYVNLLQQISRKELVGKESDMNRENYTSPIMKASREDIILDAEESINETPQIASNLT